MLKRLSEDGGVAFDPETVRILFAAFDGAWKSIEASGLLVGINIMSKPKKLVLFFAAVMWLASLSNIAGRHDAETVITSGAVALLAAFTAALIIYRHMWRKPPTEPPTRPHGSPCGR